jgi:hypothetical protein
MRIKPNYVLDSNDKKVAVQLDIETFEKMEEALENYGLHQLMKKRKEGEGLGVEEAKAFYKTLKKK